MIELAKFVLTCTEGLGGGYPSLSCLQTWAGSDAGAPRGVPGRGQRSSFGFAMPLLSLNHGEGLLFQMMISEKKLSQ